MRALILASLFVVSFAPVVAQQGTLGITAPRSKQYISYIAEEQAVKAGKKSTIEVRFQVADGYHTNSHTPKSELLIPTNLTLKPAAGVTAAAPEYPAGTEYSFAFQPDEKLDVYTKSFTVKVPVVATAGSHTVDGTLHYQACDNAACYPPKNLPVSIIITAK